MVGWFSIGSTRKLEETDESTLRGGWLLVLTGVIPVSAVEKDALRIVVLDAAFGGYRIVALETMPDYQAALVFSPDQKLAVFAAR